jgi:MFS transporter, SP family, solute carrier family 2 (myo-inositol transporter), member 13
MLGLAGIPALIQLLVIIFFPESPRWLIKENKMNEANQALKKIM